MSTFAGLFSLRTPRDLLRKLEHDYERILQTPTDPYAAFDFFVTAEHMVDWLHPNSEPDRRTLRQSSTLLQVCSHVANGSKHFVALAKHHDSVKDTKTEEAAFQHGAFHANAFQVGRLLVELQGKPAQVLGRYVEVTELASKVLDYWKECLGET